MTKDIEVREETNCDALNCRWYRNGDLLYPSVTSILGIIVPDGLKEWFKRTDQETIKYVSSRAAERGTDLHNLCEKMHKGELTTHDGTYSKLLKDYSAHCSKLKAKFPYAEILLHHPFGFAGRVDAIAEVDGKLEVWDIKTGSVDIKAGWQMAAYKMAFEHMTGKKIEGMRIMNLKIKDGTFSEFVYEHIEEMEYKFMEALDIFKYNYFNYFKRGIKDKSGKAHPWPMELLTKLCVVEHYMNRQKEKKNEN